MIAASPGQRPPQSVILVPSEYGAWSAIARDMAARLTELLPRAVVEHIGSTSVPGLPAKPVVDLMIGVELDRLSVATLTLVEHGFDLEGERSGHAWLSSPDRSAREFVVHVLECGGQAWDRRLRFRDILRTDPAARAKYLAVKQQAAAIARGWDDYTRAKAAVVAEILAP